MIRDWLRRVRRDDSGAVTVDWVVLTAALLTLGLAVVSLISAGATDVSTGIGASLGAATVPVIDFDGP